MLANIIKSHFFSRFLLKGKKDAVFLMRGNKGANHSMKGKAGRSALLKLSEEIYYTMLKYCIIIVVVEKLIKKLFLNFDRIFVLKKMLKMLSIIL